MLGFKSILVSVTEACQVGCAHCGFIGSVRDRESDPVEMATWVGQACAYGVPIIIFTGGEPFDRLECLAKGVEAATRYGVPSAVFTSSHWASSPEVAHTTFSRLGGLQHLYLSSDTYHQRRVPYQNIYHVIDAAEELNIPKITIYITYANDDDLAEVKAHYEAYHDRVRISEDRVIPNPYFSIKVLKNQGRLKGPVPDEYRRDCEISTPIINPNGDLFSCHVGKAAAHRDLRHLPYFLGSLRDASFNELLARAAGRADYQFLRTQGAQGVAALHLENPDLISAVGRDGFTTACDMCFSTLKTTEGRATLGRYVSRPDVVTEIDIRLSLQFGEHPLPEASAVKPAEI